MAHCPAQQVGFCQAEPGQFVSDAQDLLLVGMLQRGRAELNRDYAFDVLPRWPLASLS